MEDIGNYFEIPTTTVESKIQLSHSISEEEFTSPPPSSSPQQQQQQQQIPRQPSKEKGKSVIKQELTPEEATLIQKKRNCEASARYRRKKQKEDEETKRQLNELKAENKKLLKKIGQLEQTIISLTTDKKVLEAKLETIQTATLSMSKVVQ